jgi:hypothetical protein
MAEDDAPRSPAVYPLRANSLKPVPSRLAAEPGGVTDSEALRRLARYRDGDAFALLVKGVSDGRAQVRANSVGRTIGK